MYFGLQLSCFIFSATEQLSITLQGKETSLQQVLQTLRLTNGFLARQRDDNSLNSFYSRILEALDDLTNQPILPQFKRLPNADPGWGIWDKYPPPPHLVEEPAMLLIKIGTNLCQAKISLSTHENNMYILLLKPKRTGQNGKNQQQDTTKR